MSQKWYKKDNVQVAIVGGIISGVFALIIQVINSSTKFPENAVLNSEQKILDKAPKADIEETTQEIQYEKVPKKAVALSNVPKETYDTSLEAKFNMKNPASLKEHKGTEETHMQKDKGSYYERETKNPAEKLYKEGLSYLMKSRNKRAIESLENVICRNKEFFKAHYALIDIYELEKEYEECVKHDRVVRDIDMTEIYLYDFYQDAANVCCELKKFERAIEYCKKWVKMDSTNASIYLNMAKYYGELGKSESQNEKYQECIRVCKTYKTRENIKIESDARQWFN